MFENPEVALDELPDADDLEWEMLHPRYTLRLRIRALITVGIAAVAILALNVVPNIPRWPFVALYTLLVVFAIASLVWPGLSVPRRGYVVRDMDILFRKGLVWRSVTAVPFNRIQHVETSNTPLDRKFGLATLQLFTAGGSGGDLKIGGLGKDVAEKLRVFILDKAGTSFEKS